MKETEYWLKSIGFERYSKLFKEHAVKFELLAQLKGDDLKEMGIARLDDRKKLLHAINALRDKLPQKNISSPPQENPHSMQDDEEFRQVTVLYSSLVDSTEPAKKNSPEEFRTIMRIFRDACEPITSYEGCISKFTGDGIVAYFGWPKVHDDHAEHAVQAGLDLIKTIREIEFPGMLKLSVQVGIATGEVVIGNIFDETTVDVGALLGETTRLAESLQSRSEPNQIVLDSDTRNLIDQSFQLYELGAQPVKGHIEPVQAWSVVGKTAIKTDSEGKAAPLVKFVNRKHELAAMLRSWEKTKNGNGRAIEILGDSGIGKSRLIEVFLEHIAEDAPLVIRYRCASFHDNSALFPVIQHLYGLIGYSGKESLDSAFDVIERISGLDSLTDTSDLRLIASLLNLDFESRYGSIEINPQERQRRSLEALKQLILKIAGSKPLLIIVEDKHWLDPTTSELIRKLVSDLAVQKVMVITTHRAEYDSAFQASKHVDRILLHSLNKKDAIELVESINNGSLTSDVVERIVHLANSVPLYLEEITQSTMASSDSISMPLIPTSLRASLMVRLDRLKDVKEVAQVCSVVGLEFELSVLLAIIEWPKIKLIEAINKLENMGFVRRCHTTAGIKYEFKHTLIQDAIYKSIGIQDRKRLHKRVSLIMRDQLEYSVAANPELLANHLLAAGNLEDANFYWLQAGRRAVDVFAYSEAITHFTAGLKHLSSMADDKKRKELEFELRVGLCTPLIVTEGYTSPKLNEVINRAIHLRKEISSVQGIYPVLYGKWAYLLTLGRGLEALAMAREYSLLAEQQNDEDALYIRHRMLGASNLFMGKLSTASRYIGLAIKQYEESKHASFATSQSVDPYVASHCFDSFNSWLLGLPDRAVASTNSAYLHATRLKHPHSIAMSMFFLAMVYFCRKEPDKVYKYAQELISLSEKHMIGSWPSLGRSLLGWAMVKTGDSTRGMKNIYKGLDHAQRIGVCMWVPVITAGLVEILIEAGSIDKAAEHLVRVREYMESSEELNYLAEFERLDGELLRARGEVRSAENAFNKALDVARSQQSLMLQLRAVVSLARLYQDTDWKQEVAILVKPVLDKISEGETTQDVRAAQDLLLL